MIVEKVIEFPNNRVQNKKIRKKKQLNKGKKGRVYNRGKKLWVDFHYLNKRIREPSGLKDTHPNRIKLRKQLDLVIAEIENNVFDFGKRFPHSKKKKLITNVIKSISYVDSKDVLFGDYVKRWWNDIKPGMSHGQVRDYNSILTVHLIPYFAQTHFSDFNSVLIKKFVACLKNRKNQFSKPISAKRIHNIMIPLRVIVRDAFDEHGWKNFSDIFKNLKLPKVKKYRVFPFNYKEWETLMDFMPKWYKPYFEFFVQTGLRPSEQVALKWSAIDEEFIHIELSRVRNKEKDELKTSGSHRSISLTATLLQTLKAQKELTKNFKSPYVFLNTQGRPILQDKLRELWIRTMQKSKLLHRRMYDTRHTFASWALAAGESPEWVARTLGHVNTSMVYKTYGRYIPNLRRKDGSSFEKQFTKEVIKDHSRQAQF
jgi:integrase